MACIFKHSNKERYRYRVLSIWLVSLVTIVIGSILFYEHHKKVANSTLSAEMHDLSVILSNRLAEWHRYRMDDVEVFADSPFLSAAISKCITHGSDKELQHRIVQNFNLVNSSKQYSSIIIIKPSGEVICNADDTHGTLDKTVYALALKAIEQGGVLFTDFYRCETHKTTHIDYVAPIRQPNGETIAVLIFRADIYKNLYPIMGGNITPLRTAQTYLFRMEGNQSVFLDVLGEHPLAEEVKEQVISCYHKGKINYAVSLPTSRQLVHITPVSGTQWFFLKLVDAKEVNRYLSFSILTIVLSAFLLFVLVTLGLFAYYYFLQEADFSHWLKMERRQSKHFKEFFAVLHSMVDGVITTDKVGIITTMNAVAEQLFGISEQDAIGLKVDQICKGNNQFKEIVAKVLAEHVDDSKGITFEQGKEVHYVTVNASPIHSEKGSFDGAVIVLHNQTHEISIVHELSESEKRYRMLFDNMTQGFALHSIVLDDNGHPIDYIFLDVNKAFEESTGLSREAIIGHSIIEVLPNIENFWIERYGKVAVGGEPIRFQEYVMELDKHFDVLAFRPQPGQFAVVLTDVTQRVRMQKEADEQAEFIYTVLDNLPVGIVLSKIDDGRITYVNKFFEKIFGWSIDELQSTKDFVSKVLLEEKNEGLSYEKFKSLVHNQEGELKQWDRLFVKAKNGKRKYVNTSVIPIISQGTVASTVVDVTQTILTQKELMESDELFSTLFYDNSSVMLITDAETMNLVDVNRKAVEFYGWSREEMLKMHIDDINTLTLVEVQERLAQTSYEGNIVFSFKHRTKHRGIRDVEAYTCVIKRKGKSLVHSIIHDVTEEKKAMAEVVTLSQGIRYSSAAMVITDAEGKIEFVNPKFVEISGYNLDEVKGKTLEFLNSGEEKEELYRNLWETIMAGEEWRGEMLNKRKNGELYWEASLIAPILGNEGEIINFIAVKEDITSRKKDELALIEKDLLLKEQNEEYMAMNEELEETNLRIRRINDELIQARNKAEENDRLKSAFLANMSHELRTPMNGIIGFTELLKRPQLSEENRLKFTEIIEQSGVRLLELVNNLIDISRIETGQVTPHFTTEDIGQLMAETFRFFSLEAQKRGNTLSLNGGKPLPPLVMSTDRQMLNSIISNLLKNALKFTQDGAIDYGYSLEKDSVNFWVSDTGVGIAKDKQSRIFERFVQGDTSLARQYEGAGLGLSITKSYLAILGGEITLTSEPDKGSIFRFSVPFNASTKDTEDTGTNESTLEELGKHLSILITEDDSYSSVYLHDLLAPYANRIYMSETGGQSVELLKNNKDINLILMDIKLPDMSGLDAIRAIRAFNSEVHIIVQSAFASPEDMEAARLAGGNQYITKPILSKELFQAVIDSFGEELGQAGKG